MPQPPSEHITAALEPLASLLSAPEIQQAFRVPPPLLVTQIAEGDPYFLDEMQQHFPGYLPEVQQLLASAGEGVAAAAGGRTARRPPSPRRHAVRGRDPARRAARRPRLALLARRAVPESALGLHRQPGRVRRRCCSSCSTSAAGSTARLRRAWSTWAARVAAGVHRRRRRPRGGGRPDRTRRHRGAVHDPAGAAAGGAGRGRRHGAHRLRRRPQVSPHRTARRRRGAVPARAGLQRAGDFRHRQHDDGPRARDGLAAGDLRALLGALGDHPRPGRQVPGRAGRVRDLPAHHGGDRGARTGAAAPLSARRPGPGAGDSALRAAALACPCCARRGSAPATS